MPINEQKLYEIAQNAQFNEEPNKDNGNILDYATSTAGQVLYNTAATPGYALQFAQGIVETPIQLIHAGFNDDYSVKDAFADSWVNHNLGAKINENIVDPIAENVFGRKSYDELNAYEKAGRLTGDFIPAFGVTKYIKPNNITKALTVYDPKNAKKISDGYLGLVNIKTKNPTKYQTAQWLMPGIQIQRGVPLSQQKASLGIQTALTGGMNYLENLSAEQINEAKRNNVLYKDFRKDLNDPNNQISFNQNQLDYIKKQEKENSNFLLYAGLAGAIFGGSKLYNKYNKYLMKEMDKLSQDPDAINTLSKHLSTGEILDSSITDRFSYKNFLVEEGLISEEVANKLTQDQINKINSSFTTGDLGFGLKSKVTPQSIYDRLQSMKINNDENYKLLEEILEIDSKIQDDAFRFNYYFNKGKTNYSTDEYIARILSGIDDAPGGNYLNKEQLSQMLKQRKMTLELAAQNPEVNKLLHDISDLQYNLLEYQYRSGIISADQFANLKRNRSIDNLFTYKPRVKDVNIGYWDQFKKYLLEDVPYDPKTTPNINVRGENPITFGESKSFLDVFEENYKTTLLDVLNNNLKKDLIKEMQNKQLINVKQLIKDATPGIEELQRMVAKESNPIKKEEIMREQQEMLNHYYNKLKDMFYVKHIGSKNTQTSPHIASGPKNLFDLMNLPFDPKNPLHGLVKSMETSTGLLDKYEGMTNFAKDVVSYVENGIIHYYKTDPIIAASFNLNPVLPNKFAEILKAQKNLVQSTTTGMLNPFFALPSSIMSISEALLMFPTIASKLELLEPASRIEYMKQIGTAFKDIVTTEQTNLMVRLFDEEFIKTNGLMDTPIGKFLANRNIEKLRSNIKSALLTEIRDIGGASQKPYTKNSGRFFTLNNRTELNDNIKRFLAKHHGINGGIQASKLLNYYLSAMREAPQLSLTEYFGKLTGAIKDGHIVDENAMRKVIDVVGTYTSNLGRDGSGKGLTGGIAETLINYVPYGNVMLKSLAPKFRASGIEKGISNFYKICMQLGDNKTRYVDILNNIKLHSKELVNNKFIQGLFFVSFVPTLLAYIWNNGSSKNRDDYYRLSDYDKASKTTLMNFFGDGNHLIIPKDQEVAVVDSILFSMLDGIFGMSDYNEIDPAFNSSKIMMQSIARSFGIDNIPALDLIANVSGKQVNLNVFNEQPFISDLPRNVINADLSETAYQNGIFNQETHNTINSLFGVFGSAILTSGEEFVVGDRNNTAVRDVRQSLMDKFSKSAQLIGSRNVTSYNQTSQSVYKNRDLLNKLKQIDKNPKQEMVYDLIKIYNKNRIKPIHDKITNLRKNIQRLKANGKINGKILDYNGRKITINNIQKKLQELFALEYHEFENLNALIEAKFGRGLTLDTFMEKLNEQY